MTHQENNTMQSKITVHTFSQNVADSTVFYQVLKMNESFHLWVGTKPTLENMSLAMKTKFDNLPLSSQLFGDSTNPVSTSLAQRLAKKTGKQVFVSCNLTHEQMAMPGVEKRIIEEMRNKPEMF